MKLNSKQKKYFAISAVAVVGLAALGIFYFTRPGEEGIPPYEPTIDLPENYIVLVDEPENMDDMMFIASLSSIAVREQYHPMFILEDGSLDEHQLWTIDHMVDNIKNAPKLLITSEEATYNSVKAQVDGVVRYNVSNDVLASFRGFDGVIDVNSYPEALWAASVAAVENRVIRLGRTTFANQEESWDRLKENGIVARYIVVANPYDLSTELLSNSTEYYDDYDSLFHTPALSCVAAQLAAYHKAYVLTDITPSTQEVYTFENPNFDPTENYQLNARSTGYYLALKDISKRYYHPTPDDEQIEIFQTSAEYVCIVGSAAAVPQFQIPGNGDGDDLVSCDVMFGFLDDDDTLMDAAVGRIVNYNIQGASNQIAKTLGYDYIVKTVTVEYSDGPREVEWRKHGASFSGYDITYQRMQVSPARWICTDYEDEGLDYEYYGPALIEQEVTVTPETTIEPAVQASAFLAYRGHGSDSGAMYMIAYKINRDENAVLRGTEARELFIPPQVSFFVSCMNGKIHGKDFGDDAPDVPYDELFSTNYLYGGAIALGGATEVSYSNIGQDLDSYPEEFLPGIINPGWSDGDHEWNRNDAWFAFFWEGMLDDDVGHGSIGKALQWTENRYIAYQTSKGMPVTPFESTMTGGGDGDTGEDPAVHWKEVAMFVIYGDPAFTPHSWKPGENDYNPWRNGESEGQDL